MRFRPAQEQLAFRSERGSISILFAMMSLVLMVVIGAAVDYAKWHDAYTHVESTMDSALLAAGRQYQTNPNNPELAIAAAETFFNQGTSSGGQVDRATATFTVLQNPPGISGSVTGQVTTPFLGLVKVARLPLHMTGQAEFNIGGSGGGGGGTSAGALEVSLMLDVTGSMCNDGEGPCAASTKMNALKTAAKDLINILVVDGQNAKVALAPFSTRVRVGADGTTAASDLMKATTNLNATWTGWNNECQSSTGGGGSEGNGTWTCALWTPKHWANEPIMPCVTDRTGPAEFTDAAPGPNTWLNAHEGDRFPLSWDSSDTPITSGLGGTKADFAWQWNYSSPTYCGDVDNANIIMPLSNDAVALKKRVDDLVAYGSTSGALGTAWTWYMISPNWSNVWKSESRPGPYSDLTATTAGGKPKLRKIAVLMTDGDYNTYKSDKDANTNHSPDFVSNNAKSICANMKAQGIEVFTVGFDLDSLPAAEKARAINTLQTCGTDISHFYNSLAPAQLQTAFRDIALKLSQLYLSK
jgi:Flp pilus assembly protein TadG